MASLNLHDTLIALKILMSKKKNEHIRKLYILTLILPTFRVAKSSKYSKFMYDILKVNKSFV